MDCHLSFTVADIQFAFDNAKLIKLMEERGKSIAENKYNCCNTKIDEKIMKLFEDENEREKMTTILSAYVTFE